MFKHNDFVYVPMLGTHIFTLGQTKDNNTFTIYHRGEATPYNINGKGILKPNFNSNSKIQIAYKVTEIQRLLLEKEFDMEFEYKYSLAETLLRKNSKVLCICFNDNSILNNLPKTLLELDEISFHTCCCLNIIIKKDNHHYDKFDNAYFYALPVTLDTLGNINYLEE